MRKLDDIHTEAPLDFKDILNIHRYFMDQQQKTDTCRTITHRCEEIISTILQETNAADVTSGNILCSHK